MSTIREQLQIDTSGAVASLNASAAALEDNAKHVERAKDGFGELGSSAARLGAAAGMLDPALGGVVMGVADLADVGEVGAAVMGRLGVSFGATAAVVGPIALLVAGVTYAWTEYEAEVAAAEEAQKKLNEALAQTEIITRATQASVERYQIATGGLNREQADSLAINREWDARLKEGTAALEEQAAALRASVGDVGSSKAAWAEYDAKLKTVTDAIAAATDENERGRQAALDAAEYAREQADSEDVLAQRTRAKAEADREAAKAAGERREAQATLNEEMKLSAEYWFAQYQGAVAAEKKAADVAAEIEEVKIAGELALGRSDVRVDAAEQLGAYAERAADLGVVVSAVNDPMVELAILLTEVEAAAAQGLTGATELAAALRAELEGSASAGERLRAGLGKGLDIASGVTGGLNGAMGLVSQAGPVGAVIAQVVQLVKAIEDGAIEQLHTEVMDLFQGLPDVPEQLAKGVEQSISEGIPALAEGVAGLIANMPDMVWRILEASTVGLAKALAEAFKGFFEEIFGGIGERRQERQERRWQLSKYASMSAEAESRTAGGGSTARSGAGRAAGRTLSPSRGAAEDMGGQLWGLLNRSGARNNLRSTAGIPYGTSGAMRIVVED